MSPWYLYILMRNIFCQKIIFIEFKIQKKIEWVQQQIPLSRKKRDFVEFTSNDVNFNSNMDEKVTQNKFNDPMWPKLWYIVSAKRFDTAFFDCAFKYAVFLSLKKEF